MTNLQIIKQIEQQNNICLKQLPHNKIYDKVGNLFIKEQVGEPGQKGVSAYSLDSKESVTALCLDHISNNDFDYSILTKFNKIETLSVQGANFDMKVLSNLKNIKRIDLSFCGLNNISFLQNLVNLEYLDLSNNNISEISSLKNLKNLTNLNLRFNNISEFPVGIFNNLDNIDNWHEILWDNQIQSPPLKIIKKGKKEMEKYFNTKLNIKENKIDKEVAEDISNETDFSDDFCNITFLYESALLTRGREKERKLNEVCEKYRVLVKSDSCNSLAYYHWAGALESLANLNNGFEKEKLLEESIDKYRKVIQIQPNFPKAHHNLAFNLGSLSEMKTLAEKEKLLNESVNIFKKGIEIDSDSLTQFINLGASLRNLAEIKTGYEKEQILKEAYNIYKKGLEIDPMLEEGYIDLGFILLDLSEYKEGSEKVELLNEACDMSKKAIEINPVNSRANFFCGYAIDLLTDYKEGIEKEKLIYEACEMYKKVEEIDTNMYFNQCCCSNRLVLLLNLAESKEGDEKNKILKKVIKISDTAESYKKNSASFYLACAYSLWNNKDEAYIWLEKSLKFNAEITRDTIMEESNLSIIQADVKLKELLNKYR